MTNPEEKKECKKCDLALGVFGVLLAVAMAYIAIDFMSGGVITDKLKGDKTDDQ